MSYARTGSVGLLPLYPRAGAYILVGKPRQPLRCHVLQRPHLSSGGTPYTLYDVGWLFVLNVCQHCGHVEVTLHAVDRLSSAADAANSRR